MTRRPFRSRPPAPQLPALKLRVRRRGCAIGAAGLMAWFAALILPGAVLAAGKQPLSWDKATQIESAESAAKAEEANPVCASVGANISRRVANIKSLKAAIQRAADGPPTSMKSALQGLFGKAEPNAKMIAQERKIVNERRAADDLNAMLTSLKCATVDIEAALAEQPLQATGGPVVPDAMPDDLVRAPIQY